MNRLALLALVLALAGCSQGSPANPHVQTLVGLGGSYKPYADCVQQELSKQRGFDGQLPALVVDRGHLPRLEQLASSYLDVTRPTQDAGREAQVESASRMLSALGRYGSAPAEGDDLGPGNVRRTLAMIETMQLIAVATGVGCEMPAKLTELMETAKNEYL